MLRGLLFGCVNVILPKADVFSFSGQWLLVWWNTSMFLYDMIMSLDSIVFVLLYLTCCITLSLCIVYTILIPHNSSLKCLLRVMDMETNSSRSRISHLKTLRNTEECSKACVFFKVKCSYINHVCKIYIYGYIN